jgi:hypothetical protein
MVMRVSAVISHQMQVNDMVVTCCIEVVKMMEMVVRRQEHSDQ